jgi:hypothetical protein
LAGVPCHHVRVHVDRVHRIHHRDAVLVAEDVENVAAVAFRTVRDENLVVSHLETASPVVVLRNGVPKKFVTLLRAITPEGLVPPEFVHGSMHCVTNGERQRFGDVADAAANQAPAKRGVFVGERFYPTRNLRKEVARFKLQVMVVQKGHKKLGTQERAQRESKPESLATTNATEKTRLAANSTAGVSQAEAAAS